jgi:hypothetical protein
MEEREVQGEVGELNMDGRSYASRKGASANCKVYNECRLS